MKIAIFLLSGLAVTLQAASTKCNADNCARAVTGVNRGQQSSHLADCRSFLQCTVQPPPPTVTETTIIFTDDSGPGFTPNPPSPANPGSTLTNCPTAVPRYASACSGTQRYSSACSCAGVTRAYTTATPSSTVTTVVTIVSTTTPPITSSPPFPTPIGGQCAFDGGSGTGICGCNYEGGCNMAFCGGGSSSQTALDAQDCLQQCDDDIECQGFAFVADGGFVGLEQCNLCYGPVTVDELVDNNDQWGYRAGGCTGTGAIFCTAGT